MIARSPALLVNVMIINEDVDCFALFDARPADRTIWRQENRRGHRLFRTSLHSLRVFIAVVYAHTARFFFLSVGAVPGLCRHMLEFGIC